MPSLCESYWRRRVINSHGINYGYWLCEINSCPPSAANMLQWGGPALVQVMACRLFGAKPLPEPMLTYCQLDPWEQTSVKFESKYKTVFMKMHLEMSYAKWRPFCPEGDELGYSCLPWGSISRGCTSSLQRHDIYCQYIRVFPQQHTALQYGEII